MRTVVHQPLETVFKYEFLFNHLYIYFSFPSCTEPPSEPRDIRVDLGYLQATISGTEPEFLGVPYPLSPDGLVWYVGQVTRDDTGEVVIPESRVNYSTTVTSTVVDLNFPCVNYTVTVRAENKAGASMNVSRRFTLVENGKCDVSIQCSYTLEHMIISKLGNKIKFGIISITCAQKLSLSNGIALLNVYCQVTAQADLKIGNVCESLTGTTSPSVLCTIIGVVSVSVDPVRTLEHHFTARNSNITISLNCTWDPPVYYVAWYKDGILISSEDLASGTTLRSSSGGSVASSSENRLSILTIENASITDTGNYTCAVSCGAKDVAFNMITDDLKSTRSVTDYGEIGDDIHLLLFIVCNHSH